jgi:hypothetical protein
MRPLRKLLLIFVAIVIITVIATTISYRTIPTSNAILPQFDAIIVLGTPANSDGSASPEQRERTLEGIREFKAGVAPHLIFTGAAAHNQFVEAHVMATLALSGESRQRPSSKKTTPRTQFKISSTAAKSCPTLAGSPPKSSAHPATFRAPRSSSSTIPSRGPPTPLHGHPNTPSGNEPHTT